MLVADMTVGYKQIETRPDPPALRKPLQACRVDLSSLAKGFAVDQVAEALETLGMHHYMVEVGGEIRTAGLNPSESPVETYICAWPWGTYLGEGALERGVDVCVSSWMRAHPNTFPVQSKAAGHYNAAQLMKMEAVANGYVEALAVSPSGLLSEGSGQNVFLVRGDLVITPFLDGSSLARAGAALAALVVAEPPSGQP